MEIILHLNDNRIITSLKCVSSCVRHPRATFNIAPKKKKKRQNKRLRSNFNSPCVSWWDCSWRRGWGELEFIKGSIWKLLHYGSFLLPNHWEELTGSPEEGPTCSDCQFRAIICLMRPPDMMPRSWTIRAELVAAANQHHRRTGASLWLEHLAGTDNMWRETLRSFMEFKKRLQWFRGNTGLRLN